MTAFKTNAANVCTQCGEKLTGAIEGLYNNEPPKPGDYSLCSYCGHLTRFQDDMSLRPLTEAEVADLPHEMLEVVVEARLAIATVRHALQRVHHRPTILDLRPPNWKERLN